ncbi:MULTISPECIES: hypothetical protein [unclassified Bradyrhizobium]
MTHANHTTSSPIARELEKLAERLEGHLGPFNFVTREERTLIVNALRLSSRSPLVAKCAGCDGYECDNGCRYPRPAHPAPASLSVADGEGLQLLLEVRDFINDISAGAPITDASRDHATEFVAELDARFSEQWETEEVKAPAPDTAALRALEQAKAALIKIRACSIAGCEEGYGKPELWADALFRSHFDVAMALKAIDAALASHALPLQEEGR